MKQALQKLTGRAREEKGLTTLEWLLIVAAVAGLAALAIVLVQGVVDDTAEDIRGSSARGQAATIAAQDIIDEANRSSEMGAAERFDDSNEWADYFNSKCDRLGITYSDADIEVTSGFPRPATVVTSGPITGFKNVKPTVVDGGWASAGAPTRAELIASGPHCFLDLPGS